MNEFKPNTTQFPNFLFDIMATLTAEEWKIVSHIVRKTYGWHKERDRISLSQMVQATGLSKTTIVDKGKSLTDRKIIGSELVLGIREYFIIVPDDLLVSQTHKRGEILVSHVDRGSKPGGQDKPSQVVSQADTQKKEEEEKKTKQNKDTKESFKNNQIPEAIKRDNDPFAISYDPKNASIVFDELQKYTIKRFRTKPSPDPLSCSEIASRCIAENETDLREEIRYKLEIYEYCQFFSEKFAPAPKRILQAWDQLIDTALPEHKRRIKIQTRSESPVDNDEPIMEFMEEEEVSEEQKKKNILELSKELNKKI